MIFVLLLNSGRIDIEQTMAARNMFQLKRIIVVLFFCRPHLLPILILLI